jgi:hypothetical protein
LLVVVAGETVLDQLLTGAVGVALEVYFKAMLV